MKKRVVKRINPRELDSLQSHPKQIRNICVLAHVDHGKTSLTDCLLSSNGIISPRLIGQLRYLDSREDEQERGITMEASAISLHFSQAPIRLKRLRRDIGNSGDQSSQIKDVDAEVEEKEKEESYLINLIDSPGHVDFSSDVTSAIRLCDGALVVVDVIEGVCIQTHEVLKKALEEKLTLCLVLNKIDRLIIERNCDAIEAYEHLQRIIEQVNAVLSAALSIESTQDDTVSELETSEKILFAPEKGNVVFCSAIDNWGFRIIDFVPLIFSMLSENFPEHSMTPGRLLKALWGPYSWNPKLSRIEMIKNFLASETKQSRATMTSQKAKTQVPMFSQFIFQSILDIYASVLVEYKPKRIQKIVQRLHLDDVISARAITKVEDDKRKQGARPLLKSILSAWLPLSNAVLAMVGRSLPSPIEAQDQRISVLFPALEATLSPEIARGIQEVQRAVQMCSSCENTPLTVLVSKVVAVEKRRLSMDCLTAMQDFNRSKGITTSIGDNVFFAYARVFSGYIDASKALTILGPKYLPDGNHEMHRIAENVTMLPFRLMGPDLLPLKAMAAGNIVALYSPELQQLTLKTATITDQEICTSLGHVSQKVAPLLRVAIQPKDPSQGAWEKLVSGLKLLNRADPVVRVVLESNGEYVVESIGELHLERCLKDLTTRFAKVEVKVSKPLLSFKETLVPSRDHIVEYLGSTDIDYKKRFQEARLALESGEPSTKSGGFGGGKQAIQIQLQNNQKLLGVVKVVPLPFSIARALEKLNEDASIKTTGEHLSSAILDSLPAKEDLPAGALELIEHAVAIAGPNILIDYTDTGKLTQKEPEKREEGQGLGSLLNDVRTGILSGFELAMRTGPVCQEPIWGCGVVLEYLSITTPDDVTRSSLPGGSEGSVDLLQTESVSGKMMSTFKQAIAKAFLVHKDPSHGTKCEIRLCEGLYRCEFICHVDLQEGDQLGKLYALLSRRRSTILAEDLIEGTSNIFVISALLPVAEAFGIADEMRRSTSGATSTPQLLFDRWEVLDVNPFPKATTEEELEELGESGYESSMKSNVAKKYIDNLRQRKGLDTEEKLIVFAEKQRTLTRMK